LEEAKTVADHPEKDLTIALDRLISALGDLSELREWVFSPRNPMTREQAESALPSLQKYGVDILTIFEIHASLQKRRVGPPPKRRQLYVDAFERMMLPKSSLGTVTRALCKCGKPTHTGCTKMFQAGIGGVKRLLRRYAPELVSEYETLHPDRATLKSHQKSMTR
jgi:hypothetical protein